MRRIWQLWALLLWPDAGQAAHAVAEAQLAVVEAVLVGGAPALARAALRRGHRVVARRALVRLREEAAARADAQVSGLAQAVVAAAPVAVARIARARARPQHQQ